MQMHWYLIALTINPDIQIDLLYWGMSAWVNDAKDVYAAKYEWYKATTDAMYDTIRIVAGEGEAG